MTPQQLGAIIKKTGVRKSEDRKGNFYNYHTEGYSLVREYPKNRYSLRYYQRLQLARESEAQEQAFQERKREAFEVIEKALHDKGVAVERQGDILWITLPVAVAV